MLTGLILALLLASGAAVVGGGIYVAVKRRQVAGDDVPQLTDGSRPLLERGLGDLRTGDVIQYEGRDYLVEGVVSYEEDGHPWVAGRLIDGKDTWWLVVGMERLGSKSSLRMMSVDQELEMSGYPPETMLLGGVRFNLDTRGTASAKFNGDVGSLPGKRGDPKYDTVERCRWWRYESAGDDSMIVEQWSGEYRVLRGKRISDAMLEMMPGS